MDRQEFITASLEEYRQRWSEGEFPALVEALQFCHANETAPPRWLVEVVGAELHAAFHGFKPRERGMSRSYKARMESAAIQARRAATAAMFLAERGRGGAGRLIDGKPVTREKAFALAAESLSNDAKSLDRADDSPAAKLIRAAANGTAAEIEKAYNRERRKERKRLRETGENT